MKKIIDLYRFLFARPCFFSLNKSLFNLSLRGLGVMNYENELVSGESWFLNTYLAKLDRPVVLDVGANVGNYASLVLESNPQTEIYAFEPHPVNFEKLQARCKGLNQVSLANLAVGEVSGEKLLFDLKGRDGSSHASLHQGVIECIHKEESVEHSVNVVDLDSWIQSNQLDRIDLLKIDTEGNELAVLEGAKELIAQKKIRAIHIEFNEMNVISRVFFKDFWDSLPSYKFYRLLPNGWIPIERYGALNCEIFAFQNIVAILDHK